MRIKRDCSRPSGVDYARAALRRACYFLPMSASFSSPHENVLQMGLREGMTVGDFGAGTGHYARAAAAILGPGARVYAIDVQEDILKHLALNAHQFHRQRIKAIWGNIEKLGGTRLSDASLDAAILANVLFQIENRSGMLAELCRVLKPDGLLLVVDWSGSYGGIGPAPEKVVPEAEAEKLFLEAGFKKRKSFRSGAHHYGIVFVAPERGAHAKSVPAHAV